MNLAPIGQCPICDERFFLAGNTTNGYCSEHCMNLGQEKDYSEERISQLENKVLILERKLELCLNKLGINEDDLGDNFVSENVP